MNTGEAAQRRARGATTGMYGDEGENPFASMTDESRGIVYRERENPYTDTGLNINETWTEDAWRGMASDIRAIGMAYQFIVGDYTLYGLEHGFVKSYEDVAALTGLKSDTVEIFASISRSIPRLIRVNSLDFGHYRKIAPTPEDHRAEWIRLAVESNWSVRDLARAIKAHYLPSPTVTTRITSDKEAKRYAREIAKIEQMLPEKRKSKHITLYRGYIAAFEQYIAEKKKWLEQGGAGEG